MLPLSVASRYEKSRARKEEKMKKKIRKNVKLLGLYFRSDFTDLNDFMKYFNNLSKKEQKSILN
mgnify:FL=1